MLAIVVGCSAASAAVWFLRRRASRRAAVAATTSGKEEVSAQAEVSTFATEEIRKHNGATDCWVVLNNDVLNITEFLSRHPAGPQMILNYAGKDITEPFVLNGHSRFALEVSREFVIGEVRPPKAAAVALKLLQREQLSHCTVALTFDNPTHMTFSPGGHIRIFNVAGVGRSYSPYRVDDDFIQFMVKRYDGGQVSEFLHSLRQGDTVKAYGPLSGPNIRSHGESEGAAVLAAGGTAIAPLFTIAKSLLCKSAEVRVLLFACFRDETEALLEDQLIGLEKTFQGRFFVRFVFSRGSGTFRERAVLNGRLSKEHISGEMKLIHHAVTVILCGPPSFNTSVAKVFEDALNFPVPKMNLLK
jgi:ferredoxin-NADP reductase